jgi:PAS domain S-box-containing protein
MRKINRIEAKREYKRIKDEVMYHDFFELNPQPMWVYDLETYKILFVNEAASRHYGYSKVEFLELTIKDLRPAEDIPVMFSAVEFVRKHDKLFSNNVYRHQKKNGDIIIVQIQGNIIYLNGSKAELILASDITEMWVAQSETVRLNEKLLDVQKIAGLGYWKRNIQNNQAEWSPDVYEIFGRDPERFSPTNENLKTCLHPEDWYLLDREKLFVDKESTEFEHRVITEKNEIKWVFQRLRFEKNKEGKLISVHGVIQDITEKRKADEKFKAVFEHTRDAILIGDDCGNCLNFNSAALDMFGYTKQEMKGISLNVLLNADTDENVQAWQVLLDGQESNKTARLKRKDGTFIFGSISAKTSILPGFNLCVITDITRRIQKEKQLIASERRFKALVQEGTDLIGILDMEGNYRFVSESCYAVLGFRPTDLIGKNAFSYIHPSDQKEVAKIFSSLSYIHQVKVDAFRFCDSAGNWRWITTTATNMTQDTAVGGIVVCSRDITDSMLATQALKLSNDRFKMILKAANEAIFDWDILKDKVEWGMGFQDVYGYDLTVYNNHLWTENVFHEDQKQVMRDLERSMNDKNTDVLTSECRYNKADGTMALVEYRIIFMRNPDGEAIRALGSLRDITDYKQSLLTIQLQNKKLKEIAWAQSHIVRAPLARMMGLINLLKDFSNSEEEKNEILDHFLSSASEFDQIVRDISDKTYI